MSVFMVSNVNHAHSKLWELENSDYRIGIVSHTRTVVRECFKGDEASQWKRPKFDPSPQQNFLTDFHKNWQAWLKSWTAPGKQNFVFFWGSSIRLQPTPLDGYLRKIRQMTSLRVRKCLLGVPMTIFYIWTLKFPKNRHFGDRFWQDNFFATENRFNMGMLKYKLPLIVIVAA